MYEEIGLYDYLCIFLEIISVFLAKNASRASQDSVDKWRRQQHQFQF